VNFAEKYRKFLEMKIPAPRILWLGWIIWLPFLVPGTLDLIKARPSPLLFSLSILNELLFAAVYVWAALLSARDLHRMAFEEYSEAGSRRWPIVLILVVLSLTMAYLGSLSRLELMSCFIFTAAYVAGALGPGTRTLTNAAVLALGLIADWALNAAFFSLGVFLIIVVSFVTTSWVGAILLAQELRAAQAKIEVLATNAERLRIARDLHDLLGQKLSLIILKSQLSRKLIRKDPGRAEDEIGEAERTARSVLQEVRDTVGRYRRPTVIDEIKTARELLTAAGIEFAYEPAGKIVDELPKAYDEVFAWTIREGITNVVRHSRASTCGIGIDRSPEAWSLRLWDDGRFDQAANQGGHGLPGLADRAKGLGGSFHAASRPEGGFELSVELPSAGASP
jgi:two-component system sensor histidine kinase DesK